MPVFRLLAFLVMLSGCTAAEWDSAADAALEGASYHRGLPPP